MAMETEQGPKERSCNQGRRKGKEEQSRGISLAVRAAGQWFQVLVQSTDGSTRGSCRIEL